VKLFITNISTVLNKVFVFFVIIFKFVPVECQQEHQIIVFIVLCM